MTHILGIIAVTAFIILCALLPFLPGMYDSLAEPLSLMAQFFGTVGPLLAPVGALWAASGRWRRLAGKQYGIAIAAVIVSSVVWGAVSLAALVSGGPTLGLGAVAIWIYVVWKILPRLRRLKKEAPRGASPVAFYLLIVPVAVALIQPAIVAPAIEFSRGRAIRNSERLIADIERYCAVNGRYPASLLSVHKDYSPGVIGIKEYHYEPSGDSYNLIFEQFALHFGTREFVVYNPHDRQAVTSHNMDLLRLTPKELELEQSRGHYAVHDAPFPHWKYFWFD
ncbi:MAG TPA: hypothetical protein VIM99_05485 [Blastocatellia bacterium]